MSTPSTRLQYCEDYAHDETWDAVKLSCAVPDIELTTRMAYEKMYVRAQSTPQLSVRIAPDSRIVHYHLCAMHHRIMMHSAQTLARPLFFDENRSVIRGIDSAPGAPQIVRAIAFGVCAQMSIHLDQPMTCPNYGAAQRDVDACDPARVATFAQSAVRACDMMRNPLSRAGRAFLGITEQLDARRVSNCISSFSEMARGLITAQGLCSGPRIVMRKDKIGALHFRGDIYPDEDCEQIPLVVMTKAATICTFAIGKCQKYEWQSMIMAGDVIIYFFNHDLYSLSAAINNALECAALWGVLVPRAILTIDYGGNRMIARAFPMYA
jgi:hypothetical protein